MIYAGIGSRETPPQVLNRMGRLAMILESRGWHLRTGGANGADAIFAQSVGPSTKTIYLPWNGYNDLEAGQGPNEVMDTGQTRKAMEVFYEHHPAPSKCSYGAKKLHSRNVAIILGPNQDEHARAVICWTKDGMLKGGTAMGIRIAESKNIPVFNMAMVDNDLILDELFRLEEENA